MASSRYDPDYDEYLYDEYMEELYKGHSMEAIAEFTAERLQSFYRAHPEIARSAVRALDEAKSLLQDHPSAALLFTVIALEVAVKNVLLKPVVHGLVHDEAAALLITESTVGRGGASQFKELLFELLSHHGGIDLRTYKREGSKVTLWDEMQSVQKARNPLVHQAEFTTREPAELGIAAAHSLLYDVFPGVIQNLGLHLHENLRVCGNCACLAEPILAKNAEVRSARGPIATRPGNEA
jgi:hypothetical protein